MPCSIKLPCEHYEYEYELRDCVSQKSVIKSFLSSFSDCDYYKNLIQSCRDHLIDPDAHSRLIKYEHDFWKSRTKSIQNNDIWEYRDQPPTDWNSKLN